MSNYCLWKTSHFTAMSCASQDPETKTANLSYDDHVIIFQFLFKSGLVQDTQMSIIPLAEVSAPSHSNNAFTAFIHDSGQAAITVGVYCPVFHLLWSACLAPQPLPPGLDVIVPIFQSLSSKQPGTAGLLINCHIWRILVVHCPICHLPGVHVSAVYVNAYVTGYYISIPAIK